MRALSLLFIGLLAPACWAATSADAVAVADVAPAPAPAYDRATLIEALGVNLSAHYAVSETLDVDLVRPWTSPALVSGDAPVELTIVEYPEILAPSMLLRLRYSQAGRILREDTLAVRVSLWREGMVAAMPFKRGDVVSLNGVTTRRVDALRDRQSLPVSALEEDYVFARGVPAGRPLTWIDVARRPLVRRGKMVEVQATDGALVITMKALAMQDGARGETVRVRNIESKRDFNALVTAENRAEVRF